MPEECVADKHEIPHFANLCDIMLKYADVEPVSTVREWLIAHPGCKPIREDTRLRILTGAATMKIGILGLANQRNRPGNFQGMTYRS